MVLGVFLFCGNPQNPCRKRSRFRITDTSPVMVSGQGAGIGASDAQQGEDLAEKPHGGTLWAGT